MAGILLGPGHMKLNDTQNYSQITQAQKAEITIALAELYYKNFLESILGILRTEDLTHLKDLGKPLPEGSGSMAWGLRV